MESDPRAASPCLTPSTHGWGTKRGTRGPSQSCAGVCGTLVLKVLHLVKGRVGQQAPHHLLRLHHAEAAFCFFRKATSRVAIIQVQDFIPFCLVPQWTQPVGEAEGQIQEIQELAQPFMGHLTSSTCHYFICAVRQAPWTIPGFCRVGVVHTPSSSAGCASWHGVRARLPGCGSWLGVFEKVPKPLCASFFSSRRR